MKQANASDANFPGLEVEVTCSYRPVANEAIEKLEVKYKARLPQDYRRFLMWRNGGIAANTVVMLPGGGATRKETFSTFCSLERPNYGLESYNRENKLERFTFARDSFGNEYAFPVSNGSAVDCVEFVETDGPTMVSARWPSFGAFLRSLRYAAQRSKYDTQWEHAIQLNDEKTLVLLIGREAFDARNAGGWSVAESCAMRYRLKCFKAVLNKKQLELGPHGSSVLHVCAEYGFIEGIRHVLSIGGDIDQRQSNGETPLMVAARSGTYMALEFLLACGADKNATAPDGTTFVDRLSFANKQWLERFGDEIGPAW